MCNSRHQVLMIVCTSWILLWAVASTAQSLETFDRVYEPSGITQLSDGTILVVEDDGDAPLHLFSIASVQSELVLQAKPYEDMELKADDLEAMAEGKNGDFFMITSHSVTKNGSRKKKRQKLINASLVHQQIHFLGSADTLTPSIQHHLKNTFSLSEKELSKLNIEGMALHPNRKELLIGLRSPTHSEHALILTLMNPYELIAGGAKPVFSEKIISLDLEGAGIRALTYDEDQQQFLIAGETRGKKGKLRSRIWVWDGTANHQPTRLKLSKMKGIKNIEGLTVVSYENSSYILFVCDNGDMDKAQGARYGFIAIK